MGLKLLLKNHVFVSPRTQIFLFALILEQSFDFLHLCNDVSQTLNPERPNFFFFSTNIFIFLLNFDLRLEKISANPDLLAHVNGCTANILQIRADLHVCCSQHIIEHNIQEGTMLIRLN